jgi:hypothetical protein
MIRTIHTPYGTYDVKLFSCHINTEFDEPGLFTPAYIGVMPGKIDKRIIYYSNHIMTIKSDLINAVVYQ